MPPGPTPPVVELSGVYAGYGGRDVLRGVTVAIPSGAVTALVGPNGSGKSTLLAVLAGTLAPRSGTVRRGGSPRPALVVQRSAVSDVLPITVRETVEMGRWADRGPWRRLTGHDHAVVRACMERMGVADLAGCQLGALSGGQRQRALLAQGLAQEADPLLLDEPSTGLDAQAREHILAVVAEAAREGTAVVHATHSAEEAERADHVLLLDDGLVVEAGPSAIGTARPAQPNMPQRFPRDAASAAARPSCQPSSL